MVPAGRALSTFLLTAEPGKNGVAKPRQLLSICPFDYLLVAPMRGGEARELADALEFTVASFVFPLVQLSPFVFRRLLNLSLNGTWIRSIVDHLHRVFRYVLSFTVETRHVFGLGNVPACFSDFSRE